MQIFGRNFFFFSTFNKVLICGEFNGHSPVWSLDPSKYNEEGRKMEHILVSSDWICLNNGSYTWTSADLSSRSANDLTFVSPSLGLSYTGSTLSSSYSSDHFPILISLSLFGMAPSVISIRPTFSVLLTNVDWNIFSQMMNSSLDSALLYRSSIADAYHSFTETIYEALIFSEAIFTSTKKCRKFSPAIW